MLSRRWTLPVAIGALWLSFGAGLSMAGSIDASIDQGRLSLRAEAAPLADVLDAVGAAGGFTVMLRGDLSQPVDLTLEGQPVDEALQAMLRDHSVILKRDPDSGALVEVRVIASRSADDSPTAALERVAGLEDAGASAPVRETEAEPADGLSAREAFRLANLGAQAPTEDELRSALTHEDRAQRAIAIPKVGSLAPADALGVLGDVLAEDEDPLVRSRAVAALTRFEGSDASGLLRTAALGDRAPDIRIQALNALAASPQAQRRTTALARAMRDDPDQDVRRTALLALQRVGGDWARSYLERSAPRLEPQLRELAERALLTWPDGD